jgi:adenine specific DNA methylase Mod
MLNYDKTYFLQLLPKIDYEINMQILFGNRKIATRPTQSLKLLGLNCWHFLDLEASYWWTNI